MSSFTTRLEVSPMPDGRKWKLIRTFVYEVGSKGSDKKFRIPAGFVTDFASSPPPIWWLFPPWGTYGKAAILHDYLYQNHRYLVQAQALREDRAAGRVLNPKPVTREYADNVFREAMIVLGVAPWRVALMYRGVRMFGWLAWH